MKMIQTEEWPIFKNYFDDCYEASFPTSNFYVDCFQTFPSHYTFSTVTFKKMVIDEIAALPDFICVFKRYHERDGKKNPNNLVFVNEDDMVVIEVFESNANDNEQFMVRIVYDGQSDYDIDALAKKINQPKYRIKKKGNISLIQSSKHGLQTVDFELKSEVKSIELCYGEEFVPVHNKILKSLNEQDSKGIVLLHGIPGTGKSYYLKHLSTLIKEKRVMWLPQTAADSLCNPDFITFLMNNRNSILIIEDGERVIKDREGFAGSANAVSNLLNLTDGILSDCLHIQVVATFNTDIKSIDKALLRKGRLIVDYEFGKLSVDNTNRLFDNLKINHVADEGMTLADIYNFNQEDLSNHKQRKKIGFQ
jgi:SpoVK/Ycf46/Vps4 family AAA+-type ATPase